MKLIKFQQILDDIEDNDEQLFKHLERVAMMGYEFGKEFELTNKECEKLYISGLLHEIGKYQYHDMIIDGVNISINKFYPVISSALISRTEGFELISKIVLQHLENMDGSGYPYGLTKDDIHLYATMIRICDYYDHYMMKGKTHDETASMIRSKSNIIFPKKLITPFIKMIVNNPEMQFTYES